jgi:hypothetical protein
LVKFGGAGRRDNCRLGGKVLYRTLWLSAGNEEIKNARTRSVGEPHQEILRNRNRSPDRKKAARLLQLDDWRFGCSPPAFIELFSRVNLPAI